MAKKYKDTQFGIADYPHLNTADSKFNPTNPIFKTGLLLSGAAALAFKEEIDGLCDAAMEEWLADDKGGAKLTPAERKKYVVYRPYTEVEDDEGNKTGDIVFEFKQNEIIRSGDGEKVIKIGLYDAKGEVSTRIIRNGSTIRVRWAPRTIVMKSLKQVGVRLDFSMVQVGKYSQGKPQGFGAAEGFDGPDEDPDESSQGGFDQTPDGSADY